MPRGIETWGMRLIANGVKPLVLPVTSQFESIFLEQVAKHIRNTMPKWQVDPVQHLLHAFATQKNIPIPSANAILDQVKLCETFVQQILTSEHMEVITYGKSKFNVWKTDKQEDWKQQN